eukprot:6551624-Alexandrium_andersonii.AAC.1
MLAPPLRPAPLAPTSRAHRSAVATGATAPTALSSRATARDATCPSFEGLARSPAPLSPCIIHPRAGLRLPPRGPDLCMTPWHRALSEP